MNLIDPDGKPFFLDTPLFDAYELIDKKFKEGEMYINRKINSLAFNNDIQCEGRNAQLMSIIHRGDQRNPISGMTERTIYCLLEIISSNQFSNEIDEIVCIFKSLFSKESERDANMVLASIKLFDLPTKDTIDWQSLSCLYNDSSNSQQNSIYTFFVKYKNVEISTLLEVKALNIEVSESIASKYKEKWKSQSVVFDGLDSLPMENHVFQTRYKIFEETTLFNHETYLTCAASIDDAIAKTIAYALHLRDSLIFLPDGFSIRLNGKRICRAFFDNEIRQDADGKLSSGNSRLFWTIFDLGENISLKKLSLSNMARELSRATEGESTKDLIEDIELLKTEVEEKVLNNNYLNTACKSSKKEFDSIVYSVEKAFGLQWSKVHDLEDALGL
jgi:hypothetical protein